jgi:sarcosine oxidase delta subunit
MNERALALAPLQPEIYESELFRQIEAGRFGRVLRRRPSPEPARYRWVQVVWGKVLERALYDYVVNRDNPQGRLKTEWKDANRWLFGTSTLNNRLENVCLVLNIQVEDVRTWARTASKTDVKKLEHVDRDRPQPPADDTLFDQMILEESRRGDGED